jgi:protein-S-isoprenylcysteine O-methyltransferase Ste14
MSILGIGPLLAIAGGIAALVIILLQRFTGFTLSLPSPWSAWAVWAGWVLVAIGVFFWITSALAVKRAFGSGCLVTVGVYRISRNPMYAGFILFIVPGLALLLNNLLFIVVSVAMFMAFKLRISREEDSLVAAFGQEYENYRSEVRQLVPLPRRWA